MSKLLRIDEMMNVARAELSDSECNLLERQICAAGDLLAYRLAQHLNVTLFDGCSPGDGGIMASFRTGPHGEQPDVLGMEDEDGDWD